MHLDETGQLVAAVYADLENLQREYSIEYSFGSKVLIASYQYLRPTLYIDRTVS